MKQGNDILKDSSLLKEIPFTVPEGYFESFKAETKMHKAAKAGPRIRIAPYATLAATFILLVAAGTFFLKHTMPEPLMTEEDYVMSSDGIMNAFAYEMEYGSGQADAELSEEDIINYLIYTGVTAEHIELSK